VWSPVCSGPRCARLERTGQTGTRRWAANTVALASAGSPEVPRWFPDSGATEACEEGALGAELANPGRLTAALRLPIPARSSGPGNFAGAMLEICFSSARGGSDRGPCGPIHPGAWAPAEGTPPGP